MKGEKSALWEKAPIPKGLTEGGNELLKGAAGGKVTMAVGSGSEPGGESKAPKQIGHDAKDPSMEKVAGGDIPKEKGGASKSAKKGAYAGEMGGSAKGGKEKLSPMAQTVGKPRRGY